MLSRFRWPAVAATICLAALIAPSFAPLQARATLDLIADNLHNPRGLNFGPEGGLYVAEAGVGGTEDCFVNSARATVCSGDTGGITRIDLRTREVRRVVDGLPSLAQAGGAEATGPHDVEFQGRGNGYVTIGLGANPTREDIASAVLGEMGKLVRFQPNGKWRVTADLSEFEKTNPDGNLVDSNPYSVLALPGGVAYTDAGGNSLNLVQANGKIRNLAVFPNRLVPFAGGMVPMQAVPTTVTVGPDGAFYVGQLTGFPFPAEGANVYRVPADGGAPVVYASGFTKIIDIAFGPDGSLYVLQITAAGGPPPGAGPGSLIRVSPDGSTKTTIVPAGAGLMAPGGIAFGRDGSIYLTNFSTSPDGGQVVRVVP